MSKPRFHNLLRRALPLALSLGALAFFCIYLLRNIERLQGLFDLSAVTIGGLAFLAIVTLIGNGVINFVLYRGLHISISISEATGLAAVNSLANHLPFSGGIVAKAIYLKRHHQLAFSRFLGATTALYITFVATSGFVGLATYVILIWYSHLTISVGLIVAFTLMLAALGFLLIPLDHIPVARLRSAATGWAALWARRDTIVLLTATHIGVTVVFAVRYWIAFHTFSQEVSLAQCLLFSAGTVLTQLVSITPGGLGIREGIVAAISAVLGFDPGIAVVAVALDRLVATTVVVAGGVISTYFLSKKASLNSSEVGAIVTAKEPNTS